MKKVLLCWIGGKDLDASQGKDVGEGPIAQAVEKRGFDEVFLISDYSPDRVTAYVEWAKKRSSTPYQLRRVKLSSPTHFGEIYEAARDVCKKALGDQPDQVKLTFHLSPGTPAMAAVWILLTKMGFPAKLIESSREHGVQTTSVPFEIQAKYLSDLLAKPDAQLRSASAGKPAETAAFGDIIYRSQKMADLVEKAKRVAVRNVPVLLEGESGTGKELFARAIHKHSLRKDKPFIAVNCGAIPRDLVEAELFGHKKGAFTDAHAERKGHFEQANGGTLFLDEIGELPKNMQVKLLRVLQEGEFLPLGASTPTKVDVRIVAATNRNLVEEVREGRFREDLFYRIVVAYLKLPPLRGREGDLGMLIRHFIDKINQEYEKEYEGQPGYKRKEISPNGKNVLINHSWPGNIRELENTLNRAMLADSKILDEQDIEDALLRIDHKGGKDILNRQLGGDFNLKKLISEVARHYLKRADKESQNNRTEAARLLGLPSRQTFDNWKEKHQA